jgi:hypothetical protein
MIEKFFGLWGLLGILSFIMIKHKLKPRNGKSQLIVFVSELITLIIFMVLGPVGFYIFVCQLFRPRRAGKVSCKVKGLGRVKNRLEKSNNQLKEEVKKGIDNL